MAARSIPTVANLRDPTRPRGPAWWRNPTWLLAPVGLLYGALALLPIGVILRLGLTDGGTPLRTVLHSKLLLRATENTVVISLLTTVVAVLLGALLAVALWRAGPALRALLWACILLPFWTGVLIKNFAWASLLQDNGVVNMLLLALGVTDHPLTLLHTRFAVIVGMVHYVLPYAVFPIYTALQAIDPRLEQSSMLAYCWRAYIWPGEPSAWSFDENNPLARRTSSGKWGASAMRMALKSSGA